MKKTLLSLLFVLSITFAKATKKELTAQVIFENFTQKALTYGEFFISGTEESIQIHNTTSFKITLPAKGKYEFRFHTDEFIAYTYYPARMRAKDNTITIRLMEKETVNPKATPYSFPLDLDSPTEEQLEYRWKEGNLNFIIHGIDSQIPKEFLEFQEEYGIGIFKKNCVVDPLSFKKAIENNQMVADFLTRKFGNEWKKTLPSKPLGIK